MVSGNGSSRIMRQGCGTVRFLQMKSPRMATSGVETVRKVMNLVPKAFNKCTAVTGG